MLTIDCGHWNGRRNRLPHLAGSSVWQSRWGRRFRLPVEANFHRSSKSRKRLCTPPARDFSPAGEARMDPAAGGLKPRRRLKPALHSGRRKLHTDGLRKLHRFARRLQPPAFRIDTELNDIAGILIGGEKISASRIDLEIA